MSWASPGVRNLCQSVCLLSLPPPSPLLSLPPILVPQNDSKSLVSRLTLLAILPLMLCPAVNSLSCPAPEALCPAECSRLGTDLVMYPHWYVSTNNMDEASISWEACRSWCLSLSTCVSLEYHFGQHKCYLASVTPLQAAPYWREAASNLSYWQRTCA